MKEIVATLSSKGQLTVPLEVRRQLGLKQGDKVIFQLAEGEATLIAATSRLEAGYQSIPALDPPRSESEIEAIIAEERARAFLDQRQARDG
jgi:AbrB family looped-hinge helix DNA binding protein